MPEMTGPAVIDRAQSCQPGLKALLITGYADAPRAGGISAIPILAKPFKVAELSRRIVEILHG
jgi:DNA-binding NtrC family response regulator